MLSYNESVNSNKFMSPLKAKFKIRNFAHVLCSCVCYVCVRCGWVGGCVRVCVCVCVWGGEAARVICLSFRRLVLRILSNANVQTLLRLIKYLFFTRMGHPEVKW
jgi:hypothetical protein